MRTVLPGAGLLALSGLTNPPHSLAQSAAQTPKFEVSSIRPCQSEGGRSQAPNVSQGRVNTNCQTVMALIQRAYVTYANGQSSWSWSVPISGGPAWIDSGRLQHRGQSCRRPSLRRPARTDDAGSSRRPLQVEGSSRDPAGSVRVPLKILELPSVAAAIKTPALLWWETSG